MLGKKGDTNTNIKFQLCIFSNFWDINKKISDYILNSIYINATNNRFWYKSLSNILSNILSNQICY